MSRRMIALCFVFFTILTGCNQKKVIEPVSVDFVCEFRAQYNNLTTTGTLTRRTAGTLLLEFSTPENLADLSAEWDGEKVTLKYMGLSYDIDPKALPENALGEGLITAFDAALRGEGKREEADGKVTVSGLSGNAEYTYVYDAKSGTPLSLSVPSLPLNVTFTNVQTK